MSGSASQNSRVILAVDDSASMRQMVRFTLESAGYRVVQAVDGVEALDFAKNSAVDLVPVSYTHLTLPTILRV